VRADIVTALTGDHTLSGLLTGGVFAVTEISRQATPGAFDTNGEIKPCALVKLEAEAPTGPYPTSSRQYVLVLFYQLVGYDVIDPAMAQTYALLHRSKIGSGGVWEIDHASDVLDLEDQALNCSLSISRYAITRLR
jgi:hypothetical protein